MASKQCLNNLRRIAPQIQVFTHILVGFPCESEEDFEMTMQFLRQVHLDEIAIYKYEARPDIESEALPNKVSESMKNARISRLLKEFPKTAKVAL